MPHTHKRKKAVVNTGSMAGSDHRFCIIEIKNLTTQVKKKLYQNTHKALEIQYNVCQLTSFASSAFVLSESKLYTDFCSSTSKIKAISSQIFAFLSSVTVWRVAASTDNF